MSGDTAPLKRTLASMWTLFLVLTAVTATAGTPDHSGFKVTDCLECHHGYDGAFEGPAMGDKSANHRGYDCTHCHDTQDRLTPNLFYVPETLVTPNNGERAVVFTARTGPNSFADGDANYDGVCEVCHTTTNYHMNNPAGDHTHNVAGACVDCHTHAEGFTPVGVGCMECHNSPRGAGGNRRQIVQNGGDGGGDFVLSSHHVTNGTTTEVVTEADCVACHDQTNHMTYGDGVSVLLVHAGGGASVVYDGSPASLELFCLACHDGTHTGPFSDGNPAVDMSGWNGALHGPAGKTCAECHNNGHGTGNLALVGDQINTPNSGMWPVVLSAWTGSKSFADGDAIYDGICEACHTTTNFHRNNASGNHAHNTALDCRSCHAHNNGYQADASDCLSCHNTAQGAGGYRRQVVENAGDGGGDFVLASHHVTNGTTTEVVTNADCVSCHDQSGHMSYTDGVTVLLVDPAGGASIIYDGTPVSMEPFCLGCHDGTHTSPFSNGNPAPDMSAWDGNVHGPAGKTCAECHNNGHGTGNLALVGAQITTPDSGTLPVVLSAWTGPNSLADGDAAFDGACEVCHTTTNYHRNNATGDHTHQAALDCRSCHTHNTGYQADTSNCMSCHNTAQGPGGYRRQVVENSGDGGGDFVLTSHHVTNGSTTEVVTNADCVSCHDQANHMTYTNGVSVLLNNLAGGGSIVYDGTTASLTAFCQPCHDGTVSTAPFSDGTSPPGNLATWSPSPHSSGAPCAECHANGHGGAASRMLTDTFIMVDNNNYNSGDYQLCWNCHDENYIMSSNASNTFEDLHDKHVLGADTGCMFCHNPHGPTDSNEPGMISFEYAFQQGWDISYTQGRNASTAFYVSGSIGYCYVRCHGKGHSPKDYNRGAVPFQDWSATEEEPARISNISSFPLPSRGPVTIKLEKEALDDSGTKSMGLVSVTASVYDLAGRKIRDLELDHVGAGDVFLEWDGRDSRGRDVTSGVYFCRIKAGDESQIVKMVIVR